jgi:hypothetical protein
MILTATLPSGQSASRTIPYVPAPSVFPKRYRDLQVKSQHGNGMRGARGNELAVIAVGLAVQLVEHICHYSSALAVHFARGTVREGAQLIVGKLVQRACC